MNKLLRGIALVVVLGVCAVSGTATAAVESLDSIVAVVNQEPIMSSELNEAMHEDRLQLQAMKQPVPPTKLFRKQVLNRLINIKVQLQLAKISGVSVTDADVTKAVERMAQSNGITVDQLYGHIEQGGITKTEYLKQIKQQLIISKLQYQVVAGKVNISDADARAYMQQQAQQHAQMIYQVSDILFATPDSASKSDIDLISDKANALSRTLASTAADKVAAVIKSSGATATQLSPRPLSGFPDIFEAQIAKLQVMQFSPVIQAGNGFHILQLLSKQKEAGQTDMTLEQARDAAGQAKAQKIINAWLKNRRATAYIKIN